MSTAVVVPRAPSAVPAPGDDQVCRPLRADAARNRKRILRAAREVFAAEGLEATLDDIARHAGLGTGTVYRRFPDREALVEALFEERIEATVALAERCLRDEDPWRGFVTLVTTTCSAMAGDRGLKQVMLGTSYGQDRVACARERIVPLTTRLVERAQDAGVLRPGITAADVPFLYLMVGTAAEFASETSPELWQRYLPVLLDGLRAREGQEMLPVGPLCDDDLTHAMAHYRPASRR